MGHRDEFNGTHRTYALAADADSPLLHSSLATVATHRLPCDPLEGPGAHRR